MTQSTEHHVAIIGTGQMGLVMADAIAARGISVCMWGPRVEIVQRLELQRSLPERLPDFRLPDSVRTTADPAQALRDATVAINAIPAQFIRPVWTELLPHGRSGLPLVSTAKGIEQGTLLRPTEVLAELARSVTGVDPESAVLSGPTIATELAARLPAALIAASNASGLANTVQDLLNVPWIRTYTLDDPVGVEIAGATKNVIALAAGMIDGLAVGDNAKSMLLSRGLAEIARLGESLGARLETFFGIAGVGDLATTCFSPHGRNRTCGEAIGCGESVEDYVRRTDSVVEGVASTRAVLALAEREGVDMPITRAVGAILFGGLSPREAIDRLMDRQLRSEELGDHASGDATPR